MYFYILHLYILFHVSVLYVLVLFGSCQCSSLLSCLNFCFKFQRVLLFYIQISDWLMDWLIDWLPYVHCRISNFPDRWRVFGIWGLIFRLKNFQFLSKLQFLAPRGDTVKWSRLNLINNSTSLRYSCVTNFSLIDVWAWKPKNWKFGMCKYPGRYATLNMQTFLFSAYVSIIWGLHVMKACDCVRADTG